ncbi:MAG: 50S ribosomal protein L25, partial [Desulfobulbaceae bacterium]|nr:50S ribosomal protein L25 [Desulfobulbaceae bacterium]
MLQFDLNAQVRNSFGKCESRRFRVEGLTPAIVYGHNTEPLALKMNTKELTQTLLKVQRRNAVYNLNVKNEQSDVCLHVMVKELQTDPISDGLLHADFCSISLDAPLVFTVPVNFVGKAKGVDLGG